MATRITLTWEDGHGNGCVVKFTVKDTIVSPDDPLVIAIVDAINGITRCINLKVELTKVATYTVTAGTGALVASDKAACVVADAQGDKHTFKVPAPIATGANNVFLDDNRTLKLAGANVIAFSNALHTYGKSSGGSTLTAITEGRRTQGKRLKN